MTTGIQPPAQEPPQVYLWPLPEAVPARRPWRSSLRAALITVCAVAAAGVPLGLAWMLLAPGIRVIQTGAGPYPADPLPEQFVAADGWFAILGLGFGVLAAVLVWRIARRYRGPVLLAATVLGSLGAAVVAWRLGRLPGLDAYESWRATAPAGESGVRPADLRAFGVLLVPAFAAVITYTLFAGWAHDPDLDVVDDRPEPGYPASSDPAAGLWAGHPWDDDSR